MRYSKICSWAVRYVIELRYPRDTPVDFQHKTILTPEHCYCLNVTKGMNNGDGKQELWGMMKAAGICAGRVKLRVRGELQKSSQKSDQHIDWKNSLKWGKTTPAGDYLKQKRKTVH